MAKQNSEVKWTSSVKNETEYEESITWPSEAGNVLNGVYEAKKEDVGPNHSTIYNVRGDDGLLYAIWSTSILEEKFVNVPFGTPLNVQYLGLKVSKKGKNYHSFCVNVPVGTEMLDGTVAE
jgi:hypothetical protein